MKKKKTQATQRCRIITVRSGGEQVDGCVLAADGRSAFFPLFSLPAQRVCEVAYSDTLQLCFRIGPLVCVCVWEEVGSIDRRVMVAQSSPVKGTPRVQTGDGGDGGEGGQTMRLRGASLSHHSLHLHLAKT